MAKDHMGLTPLHIAVGEQCNLDIAKALVRNGAPINEPTQTGFTPLFAAVAAGKSEAARWLLENGADPYVENFVDGASPLDVAMVRGQTDRAMREVFDKAQVSEEAPLEGAGVWVVASFMNHSEKANVMRRIIGRMMFVTADRDMKARTELTTAYHDDAKSLRQWDISD
jgi:hypothetical protein